MVSPLVLLVWLGSVAAMPPGGAAGSKDNMTRKLRGATAVQNVRDQVAHDMRHANNLEAHWGGSRSRSPADGACTAASSSNVSMADVSAGPYAPPPGGDATAAGPPQDQSAGASMGQSADNDGGPRQDDAMEQTEGEDGDALGERDGAGAPPPTGRADPSRHDNVKTIATIDAEEGDKIPESPMTTILVAAVVERPLVTEWKTMSSGTRTDSWLLAHSRKTAFWVRDARRIQEVTCAAGGSAAAFADCRAERSTFSSFLAATSTLSSAQIYANTAATTARAALDLLCTRPGITFALP